MSLTKHPHLPTKKIVLSAD